MKLISSVLCMCETGLKLLLPALLRLKRNCDRSKTYLSALLDVILFAFYKVTSEHIYIFQCSTRM